MAFLYDKKPNKDGVVFNEANPTWSKQKYSLEAIINAYGFIAIIFSLYQNLSIKTPEYMAKTIVTGFVLVTTLYIMVSVAGIEIYGY